MKKQILTLTMCIALTATSALAAGTTAVTKAVPSKAAVAKSTCKSNIAKPVQTPEATLAPEQAAKKHFEEKMAQHRAQMYADLKLTADQIKKADELDLKSRTEAEPLIKKVREEKMKLNDLKLKKACEADIEKQEKALKAAKKEAKAHFEASRKEFKAILTDEQKATLDTMDKARKESMKKHKGCPCHSKRAKGPKGPRYDGPEGPGMPPVGPPPPGFEPKCPCKK